MSVVQVCQIAQRGKARKEEIGAATHGDELRHLVQAKAGATRLRHRKTVGDRAAGCRLPIAQQRVAFLCQTTKFRSGDPRRLHELELSHDVRVETHETQADVFT